jgi:acyl carrier protein
MSDALSERTCRLVESVFGLTVGTVTEAASRDSIEAWDSVNVVNLVVALEGEFDITIGIDEAVDLTSVRAIVSLLRAKESA